MEFPFLFGGTFIEGKNAGRTRQRMRRFPFLFGGTFIEGRQKEGGPIMALIFPFLFGGTFIEGSRVVLRHRPLHRISLPFRRDFH